MPLENGQDGKEKRHPEDLRRGIDEGEITASEPAAVPHGTDLEAGRARRDLAGSQSGDQGGDGAPFSRGASTRAA